MKFLNWKDIHSFGKVYSDEADTYVFTAEARDVRVITAKVLFNLKLTLIGQMQISGFGFATVV